MFHSRALNHKIKKTHERSLRNTFKKKDNSVSVHQRNLQVLATELYKIKNNIAPKILNDVFQLRTSSYNLRTNSKFYSIPVHFVCNGAESF